MQQTNDDAIRLVKYLEPFVTGFSEGILTEGQHGERVVCGGIVKSLTDIAEWTDVSYQPKEKQPTEMAQRDLVYVMIDDAVGELLLLVPGDTWRRSKADVGKIIVAEGVLYSLKRHMRFKNEAGGIIEVDGPNETFRVLVATITHVKEPETT